jgi:hypothetical protein
MSWNNKCKIVRKEAAVVSFKALFRNCLQASQETNEELFGITCLWTLKLNPELPEFETGISPTRSQISVVEFEAFM